MRDVTLRALVIMLVLSFFSAVRASGPVVQPEDCPASVPGCPCNGFDTVDDTACWQWALDNAKVASCSQFGTVVGTAKAYYYISDTLVLNSAFGGEINGNGASLEWRGAYDGSPDCTICVTQPSSAACKACQKPLFRFEDTQQVELRNLSIRSTPAFRLNTAIEYVNAPFVQPPFCGVAPKTNIVDHVFIEGTDTNGLDYGVRFTNRYGIDGDNDQSTIMNTTISGVMVAAISIEHTQSHQHRFYAVNAYGATGNTNARYISQTGGGGFTSIGGFHGGFKGAEYYLGSIYTPDTIIDSNSEACSRFIDTPEGNYWPAFPVTVLGGRFAADQLHTDGKIIRFNAQGPLAIRGLMVDSAPPSPPNNPVFFFNPPPDFDPSHPTESQFEVTGVHFALVNSNSWDPIVANTYARVHSSANLCYENNTGMGAVPCIGLAGGTETYGKSAGKTGILNVPNNKSVTARNAANSADVPLAKVNASDQVELSDATHVVLVPSDGTNGGLKIGTSGNTLKQGNAGAGTTQSSGSIAAQTHGAIATSVTGLPAQAACLCSPRSDLTGSGAAKFIVEYCYVNLGTLTIRVFNAGTTSGSHAGGVSVDYLCTSK